jgi:hypothetical protein
VPAYDDLSEYRYLPSREYMRNVGWLEAERDHPVGDLAPELIEALAARLPRWRNVMRGFDRCRLCGPNGPLEYQWTYAGRTWDLGMSELHVVGALGEVYAAPTLILHYIDQHHYLPPASVVDALRRTSSWDRALPVDLPGPRDEERRLAEGLRPGERPTGDGLVELALESDTPDETVERLREVLRCDVRSEQPPFVEDSLLEAMVPSWFARACADGTRSAALGVRIWSTWGAADRADFRAAPWALDDWWDEIRPDQRGWLWWDAEVTGARSAVVRLEKVDAAAVFGVATWLVRAAGGTPASPRWVRPDEADLP